MYVTQYDITSRKISIKQRDLLIQTSTDERAEHLIFIEIASVSAFIFMTASCF